MSAISRLAARAERVASAIALDASVHVVATQRGLAPDDVRRGRAGRQERTGEGRFKPRGDGPVRARHEAMYLANAAFGRSIRSVAAAAGISAPAVLKACRLVEDCRDDPRTDRRLDEAELALTGAA